MNDNVLIRIEKKLDNLALVQADFKVSTALHEEKERAHQKNIARFWGDTWPDVIQKIELNSTRIASLEVELAKIKTKVLVWGSILTTMLTISIPFITYYIDKK
tara:strand:- start:354 stop:662 length:309 start_codon:yes stop_codon:yes gene_type:complete